MIFPHWRTLYTARANNNITVSEAKAIAKALPNAPEGFHATIKELAAGDHYVGSRRSPVKVGLTAKKILTDALATANPVASGVATKVEGHEI